MTRPYSLSNRYVLMILYCTVLYDNILNEYFPVKLCFKRLYCLILAVLYDTVLHYTVLSYTLLYCALLCDTGHYEIVNLFSTIRFLFWCLTYYSTRVILNF